MIYYQISHPARALGIDGVKVFPGAVGLASGIGQTGGKGREGIFERVPGDVFLPGGVSEAGSLQIGQGRAARQFNTCLMVFHL